MLLDEFLTGRERDRETVRQRDRETERQRDRKTERDRLTIDQNSSHQCQNASTLNF